MKGVKEVSHETSALRLSSGSRACRLGVGQAGCGSLRPPGAFFVEHLESLRRSDPGVSAVSVAVRLRPHASTSFVVELVVVRLSSLGSADPGTEYRRLGEIEMRRRRHLAG
jgi:hypothetical protein